MLSRATSWLGSAVEPIGATIRRCLSSLGLRERLLIIYGVCALVTLALVSLVYVSTLVTAINRRHQEDAIAIWQVFQASHTTVEEIRGPLMQEHLTSLTKLNGDMRRLSVYAPVGDRMLRVASSDPAQLWQPVEAAEVGPPLNGQVIWREFEDDGQPMVELLAPLRVDGRPVGALGVYFSLASRDALARSQTLLFLIFGGGGALALLLILTFELNRLLLRPLRALEQHAQAMAHGQFGRRTNIRRSDEIGCLAAACDSMSDALQRREEENARLRQELETRYQLAAAQAITDSSTGLYNHRYLHERLADEVERAHRFHHSLSLLFCDIDYFKAVNDAHGHQFGDAVLCQVAECLKRSLRDVDIAARYGGEEFAVILPETDAAGARVVAERLRQNTAAQFLGNGSTIPITISVGVAGYPENALGAEQLLQCADRAMYQAKYLGRNQVRCYREVGQMAAKGEAKWMEQIFLNAVHSLAAAVDARDHYTHSHSQSVARYVTSIALCLGCSSQEVLNLRIAALLHDIGKIGISDNILTKPGPLTEEEWAKMREHPTMGQTIVQNIASLHNLLPLIKHHHERYDGGGYPNGLLAEEIPLGARILAVADAYHAMVSDRPYRRALSQSSAIAELRRGRGSQFDPAVVEAFVSLLEQDELLQESGLVIVQGAMG